MPDANLPVVVGDEEALALGVEVEARHARRPELGAWPTARADDCVVAGGCGQIPHLQGEMQVRRE